MKSSRALNLPNLLTMVRIFMVPILVVVLLTEFKFERWFFFNREELAVIIFILASVTDMLDGWLARRRNQITTLGQLLDPIADKLLIASVLISLVGMQLAPAWVVVVIVGREFSVTGMRMIAALHSVVIPAGTLGKWKMVTQVVAVCLIIWGNQKEWHIAQQSGEALLYLVAFISVVSMAEYFYKFSSKVDLFDEKEE